MRQAIFNSVGAFVILYATCAQAGQYDPPMMDEWRQRVDANLPKAYTEIDRMYGTYFPVAQDPLPTLNKSAVYYDCAKILLEFEELWYPAPTGAMHAYAGKCTEILNKYYTTKDTFDGFVRFAHGLARLYHSTGQQYYKEALANVAAKSNSALITPANEYIAYSREVAYAIEVYIAAIKAGISVETSKAKLDHNVEMALKHLTQWNEGIFWRNDTKYRNYRQAFMVGLTLNALAEYYDRIREDQRVPALVKKSLDDLWEQQWEDDIRAADTSDGDYSTYTPGYGGFWYWANFVDGAWVPDKNNMPSSLDLNPDTNMMLASACAWYARWLRENEPESEILAQEYMSRAVAAWEGYVVNGYMGRSDILWEGNRYTSRFIREYRRFHHAPCSIEDIDQCFSSRVCDEVGGNWTGEWCQHAAITIQSPGPDAQVLKLYSLDGRLVKGADAQH